MKATWLTSVLGGVIVGGVIHLQELDDGPADMSVVIPVFLAVSLLGVVGLGQIREAHADRKRRRMGRFEHSMDAAHIRQVLVPTWGRMSLFFVVMVGTIFTLKTLLP